MATNATSLDERTIVAIYEKRWSIEILFKELHDRLGPDGSPMQKLLGIARRQHVVCLTHLVLVHHSLRAAGALARYAAQPSRRNLSRSVWKPLVIRSVTNRSAAL